MKNKLTFIVILISLPIYGILMSVAFQIHNQHVYESALYIFNPVVELRLLPTAWLYLANETDIFLSFYDNLMLRILLNLGFWIPMGFVTFGFYRLIQVIKLENKKK